MAKERKGRNFAEMERYCQGDFYYDPDLKRFVERKHNLVGNRQGNPQNVPGRAVGPNRRTKRVADSIEAVFDMLGGQDALFEWAKSHPAEFFQMWIKLLPQQVLHNVSFNQDLINRLTQARVRVPEVIDHDSEALDAKH